VAAVDISYEMITAGTRGRAAGDFLVVGRAEQLPFRKQVFDMIVCSLAFHLFDKPMAMRELVRAVR
jgi:ubiquinone/menaquinone biosynthesis C-methylase UbiE